MINDLEFLTYNETKEILEKYSIAIPKWIFTKNEEESVNAAKEIGYPVVMKPVMSSSGKGQSVVNSQSEIAKDWEYACSGMRGDRQRVIIEEFIDFEYEITL